MSGNLSCHGPDPSRRRRGDDPTIAERVLAQLRDEPETNRSALRRSSAIREPGDPTFMYVPKPPAHTGPWGGNGSCGAAVLISTAPAGGR